MPVRTSVETIDRHKVKIHVEVDASTFDLAIDAAFNKLALQVRVPGFRKGRVPRRVLETRLGGSEALREEALKTALPEYFAEALEAESIDPVSAPEIDNLSAEEGSDVSFDAIVEVRPKVDLGDWKSISITVPGAHPTDQEVDAQLERLRTQFSDLDPVARPAAEGDFVSIDIRGYVHSEDIPGTSATDLLYQVGSGGIVPKLDAELVGKRVGEILKFNDFLPEGFGDRAGEEVTFQVLVKEVSARRLPEVTDEWVQEVSEFETAEDLRTDVRSRISVMKKVEVALAARDLVIGALIDRVTEDPPDSMVGHEMEHLLQRFLSRLQQQKVSLQDFLEAAGQDEERFIEEMRVRALRDVKADLALRSIAQAEHIRPTDEDLEAEVSRIADRSDRKHAEVQKSLEKSGAMEVLRSDMVRRQALEFALRSVEILGEDGSRLDLEELLSAPFADSPEPPEDIDLAPGSEEVPTDE